ncbi:MAG: RtcB family protein [Longimicrobiales bacterium]|nr:RtcB family protein [Longimicrobiales bacterium]
MDLKVEQIDEYRWRVPKQGKMRVEGLIFADEVLMKDIRGDEAVQQVANVATLPGIVGRSIGMPDIHWGYGFAIGGVAAFDADRGGVISPGGVGYDINCGVRLLRSDLDVEEVRPKISALMDRLYDTIPAGVGQGYDRFVLSEGQVREILQRGAAWAVDEGYGWEEDLERIEDGGALKGAEPDYLSKRAIDRGKDQVGTVGSGNHFIEVGHVDEVYHESAAERMGLKKGTVTAFVHSGSRGLGYQVCDDFLDVMEKAGRKYDIELPDKQLACAPIESEEGQRYIGAMRAAANYAFTNRQMMAHRIREGFEEIFDSSARDLGMQLVYDVAHNNAKFEKHRIPGNGGGSDPGGSNGEERTLCVHRKGATRAFPPGHPELGEVYEELGQPVFIPGDMGRYSYVLVGTEGAYDETFGSTCHGAGRKMSRTQAKKQSRDRNLTAEFREQGIEVRASSGATVAEEVPEAYKDVSDVVRVVDAAGIGRKVARLRPLGVLKG